MVLIWICIRHWIDFWKYANLFWIDLEKGSKKLLRLQAFFPWPRGERFQDWCEMVPFINSVAVQFSCRQSTKVDCQIIQWLESHEFCSLPFSTHAPSCFNSGVSRHVGKNVFLGNKVRLYYFSATVGLAAMLQGFKVSPPLPGLCVGIRTFQRGEQEFAVLLECFGQSDLSNNIWISREMNISKIQYNLGFIFMLLQ